MKKVLFNAIAIFSLAILFSFNSTAQNRSIQFENGSWSEIVAKAKSENKPIFVDAYAVWCGPCKWMSANVFTNDAVADFYNERFINVKMDMEKGEGVELAKAWKIAAYPTLYYFDQNGELMHQVCGGLAVNDFVIAGEAALDPKRQLKTVLQKYEQGNREAAFMQSYITQLAAACLKTDEVLLKFFNDQPQENWTSESNWALVKEFISDYETPVFQYLDNNQEKFIALYGEEAVNQKISEVYINHILMPLYFQNVDLTKERREQFLSNKSDLAKKLVAQVDVAIYELEKDWKKYKKAAIYFLEEFKIEDADELNNIAYAFYTNFKGKKDLEKAISWAEKSISIKETEFNLDTYAHLLHAVGKTDEAIVAQKKAIEFGKKVDSPILADLEENLLKFEKAKLESK